MLPNHRLLARAFHRAPLVLPTSTSSTSSPSTTTSTTTPTTSSSTHLRTLHTSPAHSQLRGGRSADENTSQGTDTHNVQQDAAKAGKEERASGGGGGSATSEKADGGAGAGAENPNKKAERETKAPGVVIGMNDERGGRGH